MRRAAIIGLGLVAAAATLPGTIAGVIIACATRREPVDYDSVDAAIAAAAVAMGEG
jgi:hypothetical protein